MAFIYDLADVWADGATTFTAIKMDVTDTASAAASLLLDLQVGGSNRFSVRKDGRVTLVNGPYFIASGANGYTFSNSAGGLVFQAISFSGLTIPASAGVGFRWDSNTGILYEAANTLAQSNGTNAQTFNLYNTYTDASNYERGFMRYVSNAFEIGHEAAGTGTTTRELRFVNGGAARLTINSSGHTVVALGRSLFLGNAVSWTQLDNQMRLGGGALEMVEQTAPAAPAANGVRIYAEDDGAGKTRLMALFPTGAAQQIAIEP
jgi:hypothetical protein